MPPPWPRCGHPRTAENSKRVGWLSGGVPSLACRACQRESGRRTFDRYHSKGRWKCRPAQEGANG